MLLSSTVAGEKVKLFIISNKKIKGSHLSKYYWNSQHVKENL